MVLSSTLIPSNLGKTSLKYVKENWTGRGRGNCNCITAIPQLHNGNTRSIWQHITHNTDQLSSSSCPTIRYKQKAYLSMKSIHELLGAMGWGVGSGLGVIRRERKKDGTERTTGLGKRTRQETEKCNQITALRFQTRGGHQTSDIHGQAPFRACGIRLPTQILRFESKYQGNKCHDAEL